MMMARNNKSISALQTAKQEAEAEAVLTARANLAASVDLGAAPGPRGPGPRPGSIPLEERLFAPGETPPKPPETAQPAPPPKEVIPPTAKPASMKLRHWAGVFLFMALCMAPIAVVIVYLFGIAEEQYASTTGFTVQREESASASDFLGIIPGLGSGGGASDTDVLYEFIRSQEIVARIDAKLDLRGHYAQHWEGSLLTSDKVFSIWPDATIEDLLWFWKRVVRISYDQSSGLIELTVLAFDPVYAQALAREIVAESQEMINALSDAAREDATRYALDDLDEALDRLIAARQALTEYRTRTQIVDPLADLQGRLGVMNNLQQQLAQALIDFDLLLDTTNTGDPRLSQAERRIAAIRQRIISERNSFVSSSNGQSASGVSEDYPLLIAEFERLTVDREYAEESYRAALTALDVARANAARQTRYLATYIDPTRAEKAEYPQRVMLTGLISLFIVLSWSILVLMFYALRDRR